MGDANSVAEIRKRQFQAGESGRPPLTPSQIEETARTYDADKPVMSDRIRELTKKQSGTLPLTDEERRELAEWYADQKKS